MQRETDGTTLSVVFVAGGAEQTDPPPVVLCRRYTGTDAELVRLSTLVVALLRYLNTGGTMREMGAAFAGVYSGLRELKLVGLELFQILRGTPPTVVWRDPDGEYLRVVEEDFSELLTEQELADALNIHWE